jgi:hypothetical protein
MTVVGIIRPDSWDFPLLVHVLGAMLLVGGLITTVVAQVLGWRGSPGDTLAFGRIAFRALLFVVVPAWVVMRVGAQWIYSREGWNGDNDPGWLGVGYLTADLGAIVLLLSVVLAGVGVLRLTRSGGGASVLGRIATVLAAVLLVAYLVTVWAMSAKPD